MNLNPAVDRLFFSLNYDARIFTAHNLTVSSIFCRIRDKTDRTVFASHGCVATPCNGAPERGPRGPAKRGSGSGGDARPRLRHVGHPHPATGSHLPAEGHRSALRGRTISR